MATSADTRIAASAQAPLTTVSHRGTFDPADWLASYTALGGVYVANGKLNLCILVNQQSDEELSRIRRMVADLTDDDKAAILAYLKAAQAGPTMGWQEVVAKFEADRDALTAHPYSRMLASDPGHDQAEEEANALGDISSKSLATLIGSPPPTLAALRQKLDIISAEYAGFDELTGIVNAITRDLDRLTRAAGTDQEILDAWQRRRDAYTRYNALPNDDIPGEHTPAESAVLAIIDDADEQLCTLIAATPQGIAAKLWTSLQHSSNYTWDDEACMRQDIEALESRGGELDWNIRLILSAIRSLKSMEA